MSTLDEQTARILAAAEQDAEYAAALKAARLTESAASESFVEQAARTVAAVEALARRAQSIADMRREKGKAHPVPRPTILRDVYDVAVLLNNALCDTYEGAGNG